MSPEQVLTRCMDGFVGFFERLPWWGWAIFIALDAVSIIGTFGGLL